MCAVSPCGLEECPRTRIRPVHVVHLAVVVEAGRFTASAEPRQPTRLEAIEAEETISSRAGHELVHVRDAALPEYVAAHLRFPAGACETSDRRFEACAPNVFQF